VQQSSRLSQISFSIRVSRSHVERLLEVIRRFVDPTSRRQRGAEIVVCREIVGQIRRCGAIWIPTLIA